MSYSKRCLVFGSLFLLAVLLLTFSPIGASKAFAAALNGCPPTQTENGSGNSGSWVEVLQYNLNGYASNGVFPKFSGYPLAVDGQFGPNTENGVLAFQQAFSGLFSDARGVVGSPTWAALGYCNSTSPLHVEHGWFSNSHTNCPPGVSYGSSGILVEALQDILNMTKAAGMYSSTYPQTFTVYLSSDGSFGSQTQAAATDYQYSASQHGSYLNDDGQVGQHTWSVLGMCW